MILVIDNYDSFVFNVCATSRNWAKRSGWRATTPSTSRGNPGAGPAGRGDLARALQPDGGGVSLPAIRELSGAVPLLGVCLGHQ